MKLKGFPLAAILCFGYASSSFASPRILIEPLDQSVSTGAVLTNLVSASSAAPPLSYQWRFNDAEVPGATNRTLVLTNIQTIAAGRYVAVVSDNSGSVTSRVVRVEVDSTFTMITAGPVVTDVGISVGVSWGDFNNDNYPDLFIGNATTAFDFLYRNKGNGTFERVPAVNISGVGYGGGAWADYDNDGLLDLYTVSARDLGVRLFHNEGGGVLRRMTNSGTAGSIVSDHSYSGGIAWGDYDNDGFVDAFVANGTFGGDLKNFLFHNEGTGRFSKVVTGSLVNDLYESWTGAWADYDDDGLLDLFVTSNGGHTSSGLEEDNQWFHNDGAGSFSKRTAVELGLPEHDRGYFLGCAWGDYDNDGHVDLFIAGTTNLLYHNNGDGTFRKITTGEIATDSTAMESFTCNWVDYDNDGYLDLFVVNVMDDNFLYHNNRDGTFTKFNAGSLVHDGQTVASVDCAWADYDNDGFMDVAVVAYDGRNFLFHNNGNSNHWIQFKLVGTASNRTAIGAKVRVLARLGGQGVWQRRDISSGGSDGGQSDLRAAFGLGGATMVDLVRIEWPSGTIQEFRDVKSDQFLTITEPAHVTGKMVNGKYQLTLKGGTGFSYDVQSSTNFVDWTSLRNITTTNMSVTVTEVDPEQVPRQFFRAVLR